MNFRALLLTGVVALLAACNPPIVGAPCEPALNNCPDNQTCVPTEADPAIGKCTVSTGAGGGTATGGGAATGGGTTGGGAGGGVTGGGDGTGGGSTGGGGGGGGGGVTGGGAGGGGVVDDGGTDAGLDGGSTSNDGGTGDAGVIANDGGLGAVPALHDFGDVALTTSSAPFSFTIDNSSNLPSGALTVGISGPSAASFHIATNSCTGTLGASGTCQVSVTYDPTALGRSTATLDVAATPGGTLALALSGNAIPAATLSITPTMTAYGNVVLGQPVTNSFQVQNVGGTPSSVVTVTTGGTNGSEFFVVNSTCNGVLAPSARCSFDVSLAPSQAGTKSATVSAQAATGGTATATLTGTAQLPAALTGTPSPGLFATTEQGTDSVPVNFTISNTGGATTPALTTTIGGTNAADFVVASNGCTGMTVLGGGMCSISLRFHPNGSGSRSGTLTVGGTGLIPVVINLGGTGLTPALLQLTPNGAVSFGNVASNSSATLAFGVVNTGQSSINAISVNVSGNEFALLSNTCTGALAGGANCDLSVRFTPGSTGGKMGGLSVTGTSGGMQTATLTGTGVTPGALSISPAQLAFGDVVQGQTSVAQTFTITNTGASATSALNVSIVGAGAGFVQTGNCSASLNPGAMCTINVTFGPVSPTRGIQNAQVQVVAGASSVSGSVSGNAQKPALLTISPSSVGFANTTVNTTSASDVVTITNTGDQDTSALTTPISPDFVIVTSDCPATLAGGAVCGLRIAFKPLASGPRTGAVTATAAVGGSAPSTLSGTGLSVANLTITPVSGTTYGNVVVGDKVYRDFTITNTGQSTSGGLSFGLTGTDFFNSTGSMPTECTVNQVLVAGNSCRITIGFNPQAAGARSTTLTVSGTPGGSPTLGLSGVGLTPASLSPATVANTFPQTEVGTNSVSQFQWTLTNNGQVATPTLSTVVPAPFAVVSDTCAGAPLGAGLSCTVKIRFSPTAGGVKSGTATVSGTGLSASATLSGTGVWRLTVTATTTTGWVDSLDGSIIGCNSANPANCSALFLDGVTPTLRARTANGSGFHFQAWSAPAGCVGTLGPSCNLVMNGPVTATPVFSSISANLIFVTSGPVAANLGGVGPYDTLCNTYASDAGINNATGTGYVAWISTTSSQVNARYTAIGGLKRLDGLVVATSRAALLANAIRYPPNRDQLGMTLPPAEDSIWTGSGSNGAALMNDCSNWTLNNATGVNRGIPSGGPEYWSNIGGSHTCNNAGTHVLCLGNTSSVGIGTTGVPSGGKRVFRATSVVMPVGVSGANAVCNSQATTAGIGGTWAALIATSTATAAANAGVVDTTTYYRVDGTRVATGAELKAKVLTSGIWQNANGTYALASTGGEYVWTGAANPNVLAATPATESCSNWGSTGSTTHVGRTQSSNGNFFDVNGLNTVCTTSNGLYCVEQ